MKSSLESKLNFIVLAVVVCLILLGNKAYDYSENNLAIDSGDTAWMIVASAFVLLMTAVFAAEVGLVYGETRTIMMHLLAILIVASYTLIISFGLFKLVNFITPIRVREDQEERGLDASQHGENFI